MSEKVKTPTYLELISRDKEASKKEELKVKAQEVLLGLSKEILNLKQQATKIKRDIESLKSMYPYDFQSEYNATVKLQDEESKLAFLENIKEERFSDSKI